jgi:protein SCO1/2
MIRGQSIQSKVLINTITSCVLVVLIIVSIIGYLTQGFSVLTAEDARRQLVQRDPLTLPNMTIHTHLGAKIELSKDIANQNKITILTLIYSRCKGVCSAVSAQYRWMQETILQRHLDNKIQLLTLSFDTQYDTLSILKKHAKDLGVQPNVWQLAASTSYDEMRKLLKTLGIVVIKTPEGEFEHNAAFHILNHKGQVVRIFSVNQIEATLQTAINMTATL